MIRTILITVGAVVVLYFLGKHFGLIAKPKCNCGCDQ